MAIVEFRLLRDNYDRWSAPARYIGPAGEIIENPDYEEKITVAGVIRTPKRFDWNPGQLKMVLDDSKPRDAQMIKYLRHNPLNIAHPAFNGAAFHRLAAFKEVNQAKDALEAMTHDMNVFEAMRVMADFFGRPAEKGGIKRIAELKATAKELGIPFNETTHINVIYKKVLDAARINPNALKNFIVKDQTEGIVLYERYKAAGVIKVQKFKVYMLRSPSAEPELVAHNKQQFLSLLKSEKAEDKEIQEILERALRFNTENV